MRAPKNRFDVQAVFRDHAFAIKNHSDKEPTLNEMVSELQDFIARVRNGGKEFSDEERKERRYRFERPALKIVTEIKEHLLPQMTEEEGGWTVQRSPISHDSLHWALEASEVYVAQYLAAVQRDRHQPFGEAAMKLALLSAYRAGVKAAAARASRRRAPQEAP